jgi:hypothetical protein
MTCPIDFTFPSYYEYDSDGSQGVTRRKAVC